MIVYFGTRLFGRVDEVGPQHVATKFFHISYVPLLPLESTLVLEQQGNTYRGIPIPLHGRSLLLGYARPWLLVAAGIATLWVFLDVHRLMSASDVISLTLPALALVLAWWGAISFTGGVARKRLAQWLVYERHTGVRYDPAELEDVCAKLAEPLRAKVVDRGRSLVSTGYRTAYDPETQWPEIALDPMTQDGEFVAAAFTLARIEWAEAEYDARVAWHDKHEALWQRLCALDASVDERASNAHEATSRVARRTALLALVPVAAVAAVIWYANTVRLRIAAAVQHERDIGSVQYAPSDTPAYRYPPYDPPATQQDPSPSGTQYQWDADGGR